MKKMKKNNKGFSLVELIVVILIMAIIAVALAPQVIKWVDRSKQATDRQNYESLVANCQLALVNSDAYKQATAVVTSGSAITITITDNAGATPTIISATGSDKIKEQLDKLDANWQKIKRKDTSATNYTILIYNGIVEKGNQPAEVAED